MSKVRLGALVSVGALFVGLHLAAVYTENVNWDEFALLQRTANMLKTGAIQGGRLGAADHLLAPLVGGCVDAIATVRSARLLWAVLTFAALAGFGALIRVARAGRPNPAAGAVAAVALLALAPPFLRWSLHVRTDQGALAFGLWGGAALLASRRRPWLAVAGGFGLGVGFLFTQKLAYVAVLVGILLLADLAGPRAEMARAAQSFLLRGLAGAVAASAVIVAYRSLLTSGAGAPPALPVAAGLRAFAHYRNIFGYAAYQGMLPSLIPHLVLLLLFAHASIRAAARSNWTPHLTLAWTIVVAGLSIGIFHAGAFPYFWMTLGLFPCAAVALAWEETVETIPGRWRSASCAVLVVALIVPALVYSWRLLADTQRPQREALAFVARNFEADTAGFQLEGALFCRRDPEPFPLLFRQHIEARFEGPAAAANIERFLGEFRRKQVRFVIASHMTPILPAPIQSFWHEHYVPYFGPVWILGRALRGASGQEESIDLLAGARYRWLEADDRPQPAIAVDGRPLAHGGTIDLEAGSHRIDYLRNVHGGALTLAVDEPPRADLGPFYSAGPIREFSMEGYW